ncbi:acetate kinase [Pseudomonas citronellolis]|uniref:Acetate kinase n=2 Tax=Pseudomonas TaxID=286 RepID=A0AAW6P3R6_9PSED|nr:acetate kinase [Pseudomonas citronellolis]MDF3841083.1 acetate kinase [Pseudomonas citronellolis]WRT85713.1 acetate kinase [Pseudomonas citronellolis]
MSDRSILVINCGSSSIKFALVDESAPEFRASGIVECLGTPQASLRIVDAGGRVDLALPNADHRQALARLLPLVQVAAEGRLQGIGHRVVHGGEHFSQACRIDPQVMQNIRDTVALAPLHNPGALAGIEAALALYPQLPQVAVFDTAFHQSLPEHAYRYALPERLYRHFGVRRYGFHGTSHRYVSQCAATLCGLPPEDSCWLSAHLGNGCSTCAIVNGRSRDTSMGMTPLEGLVMGTRSGDVDPNLHGHLIRSLGWTIEEVDRMLNEDSGLLGLSGLSNDMRTLEQARARGHAGAALAIEVFCYRLAKSLAAMGCAMPRIDGLVFTGGIGENSVLVRARTLAHLGFLGFAVDEVANAACVGGRCREIHQPGSPRVLVVPTAEERMIALDTLALLG